MLKSHGTDTAFVLKAHGKYSLHMFTYAYPFPRFIMIKYLSRKFSLFDYACIYFETCFLYALKGLTEYLLL